MAIKVCFKFSIMPFNLWPGILLLGKKELCLDYNIKEFKYFFQFSKKWQCFCSRTNFIVCTVLLYMQLIYVYKMTEKVSMNLSQIWSVCLSGMDSLQNKLYSIFVSYWPWSKNINMEYRLKILSVAMKLWFKICANILKI